MYVDGRWRRIDVDDRLPMNPTTGKPLLPMSSNRFELWPLLLSKALCVVTRRRWNTDAATTLDWLARMTGWRTNFDVLRAELPSATENENGVEGREHYSGLVKQTWPRILPCLPHQVIVYEEDEDDDEEDRDDPALNDALDRAEDLFGGGEDSSGESGEGGGGTMSKSSSSGSVGSVGGSGGSGGGESIPLKPKFEIHVVCVGEEPIVCNGARTVGAEAAEAALQEALSGGESVEESTTLSPNCIYHIMSTRGGDDAESNEDLHDGVEEEVVVADDRDVEITVGMGTSWLTLDLLIAAFVDPFTAEKGIMSRVRMDSLEGMTMDVIQEKRWRWAWLEDKEKSSEGGEGENGESGESGESGRAEVEESAEEVVEVEYSGDLVIPVRKGMWKRLACLEEPMKMLYFPLESKIEEGEETKETEEAAAPPTEEAATAAAAAAAAMTNFVVRLSNHASFPHVSLKSSECCVTLRRLSDGKEFKISTLTEGSMDVPLLMGTEKEERMFELVDDAPAGCTITVSSSTQPLLLDLNEARRDHLGKSLLRVKGLTEACTAGGMSVPLRLHFEIPEAVVVEGEESEEKITEADAEGKTAFAPAPVPNTCAVDCSLTMLDVALRPFATMYVVNEDDGSVEIVPLLSFLQRKVPKNKRGYTIMVAINASNGVILPSSAFTLDLVTDMPLVNVVRHTVDSKLFFSPFLSSSFLPPP